MQPSHRRKAGRLTRPHGKKSHGAAHAQTSIEFIILLAALAVAGLVLAGLLSFFSQGNGVQLEQSKAYWNSQAGPIKVVDWSMTTTKQDSPAGADANLSLVLSNPTRETITIHAITLTPGNFSSVVDAQGNWLGLSGSLSIILLPGEQKTVIAMNHGLGDGAYIPTQVYSQTLSFSYSSGLAVSQEIGTVPLVGDNQITSGPIGACPANLVSCNGVCVKAGSCCGAGACNPTQTCCGATCCDGSSQTCQNGACVAAVGCDAPNFTCGGACCDAASYNFCTVGGQCQYCGQASMCGKYCCGSQETCVNASAGSQSDACAAPVCTAPNTTCGITSRR